MKPMKKHCPEINKKHIGKWMALSRKTNEILGYSGDLQKLTRKHGKEHIVYKKALDPEREYAF